MSMLDERLIESPVVVSISGGKDSTAAALWCREAGIPFRLLSDRCAYRCFLLLGLEKGRVGRKGYSAPPRIVEPAPSPVVPPLRRGGGEGEEKRLSLTARRGEAWGEEGAPPRVGGEKMVQPRRGLHT